MECRKKNLQICREKILLFFKKKFIKIGSVVLELIGFEKIGEFKKCISSKSTEPILINFFFKESRIFSLQICEDFLSKFHLGNIFIA